MLAAGNLLESLSQTKEEEITRYENDDYDFGEALKLYEGTIHNQDIRYSDGKARNLSFD